MVYYTGTQKEHIFNAKNIAELHRYLSRDPRFKIALLTKDKKIAYASIPSLKFPIKEGFFEDDRYYYYVDIIEVEHLKQIHYIVVRADTIDKQLQQTRKSIYMFLIFSILFLSAVIYALSKLFLQPLRDAIAKLDQFIRDTTHELNTPLSVITMSIEQLDKSSLDIRHLKHINRIDVASRTISNLYNDLAFLMMNEQSKKNDLDIELKILFEERIEYFKPLAQAKKITIHTDLAKSNILIDKEKMIRIIDNLLSNAIKYNKPAGDIYITITKNSLSIRDTGIGIARDNLEEIFNRYTRFDNANGGFGIGLNIIQMICQEYAFKITVDSELSLGTTFKITWF
jgi:two-component system OmpR family sensor kinase